MDNSASFSTLPLPLVYLSQQVEESLLGVWNIAICRPAKELELTHYQLALLELEMQQKKSFLSYTLYFVDMHPRVLLCLCCITLFWLC